MARQRAPQLDLWEIEALLPVMEVSAKVGGSNFLGYGIFVSSFECFPLKRISHILGEDNGYFQIFWC